MIAIFLLTGLGMALFVPQALPKFIVGRIATVFLLGVGATGALLFVAGAIGIPLRPPTFVAIPLLATVVLAMRWRRAQRMLFRTRMRGDRHEIVSTGVILLPFALLLWTTSVIPLADYDGRTTWMEKAHAIAKEGSIRGPFFHGQRGLNLHNRYPLLMPLDAAALLALGGAVRPLYVLIPAALFLAVRDLLSRRYGTASASWCIAALAWLPQVVAAGEGGATSAYSDLAVAAFFGMAVATLVACGRRSYGAVALWAAFVILTKNEGLLLAIAVMIHRPKMRHLIAPLLAVAVLLAWQRSVPEAYDERNAILILDLPRRIAFIDDAARAMARSAIDVRTWGALWPVVFLCAAFRRRPAPAIIALLIAFGGYILVLASTSWDIGELARVAANRLLLHGVIPAGCIVAACTSSSCAREVEKGRP